MRKSLGVIVRAGLVLLATAGCASAYDDFIATWRANYPAACNTVYELAQDCTLCHGGGFSLNPYGADLADHGVNYDVVGLLDSDNDGRTNDEEITIDCSAPGDATSAGDGATWSAVKALFD